jgi:peptide/nickel transport system permease protein
VSGTWLYVKSWGRGFASLLRHPSAAAGLALIAVICLLAVLAPWIAGADPDAQALTDRLQPPSLVHWFGTDNLGRDIFARVLYGSRITLLIVLAAALTVAPIGLAMGITAGYFGRWVDVVLMRVTDIFMAFPRLILALAFVAVLGPGIENAVLAIALTAWPPYARLARAETLSLRRREFVMAAQLQGASHTRILRSYILPLCLPTILARLTLDLAGMILIAAGLGFLGLGVRPPQAEWGSMVAAGRDYVLDQWWIAAIPGAAIFIASLGFNLLGDGVRDVLDPRSGARS